jgi:hypothetical protein
MKVNYSLKLAAVTLALSASPRVGVSQTTQTYGATSLNGGYVFHLSGAAADPQGRPTAILELGLLTADGAGNLSGNETLSLDGSIIPRTFSGRYAVNPDGAGSITLYPNWGPAMNADIVIANGGRSVKLVLTDLNNALSGELDAQAPLQPTGRTYDATSINGGFDFNLTGYAYDTRSVRSGLITEVGRLALDGGGNVTGYSTLSLGGGIIRRTFTGSYTVNADGAGSLTLSPSWGPPINAGIIVSDAGTRVDIVLTDSASLISGVMKAQAPVRQ